MDYVKENFQKRIKHSVMIKRIVLSALVACFMYLGTSAQLDNNRTVKTRIADLLAMLPAENNAKFQSAMVEMDQIGKPGIKQLASMLLSSGKGDDSKVEYALGGYSFYVSQKGKEQIRKITAEAYCEQLLIEKENENKQFLIYQLQVMGGDESVPVLQRFLSDEYLCGPAARALAKINTRLSGNALFTSLKNASGLCVLSLVEALGDAPFTEAVSVIENMAQTNDQTLKKVVLNSLAKIGAASSFNILSASAASTGFTYKNDNATAAYILYLSRLIKNGNIKLAEEASLQLYNQSGAARQVHTQTAALKIYTDIRKEKAVPFLIKAMQGSDAKLRAAALKFALSFKTTSSVSLWLNALKTASPVVKAEIVTMLGQMKANSALPTILGLLKSKDVVVRLAAIQSAGQIGNEQSLPYLLQVMQKGNSDEINAVKGALMMMKGATVADKIAKSKGMSSPAKAAIIDVLAARGATQYFQLALSGTATTNPVLRASSFAALKNMSSQKNIETLFALLTNRITPEETKDVQSAIIKALKQIAAADDRVAVVLTRMKKMDLRQQTLVYPVLAGIGGIKALEVVTKAFQSGSPDVQKAVLESLASWTDADALDFLYSVAKNTKDESFLDLALKGYVRSINMTSFKPEQKVLLLRKGMEVSKTWGQKDVFINEMQRHKTFNAMVFAGRYLDEPNLQQAAAETVRLIALGNKDFQGTVVRSLLNKAAAVMSGKDAEYRIAAIQKYLAEMPENEGFVSLFNGKDLTGWKGLVGNPITRAKMHPDTLVLQQQKADVRMREGWSVVNGDLVFNGHGENLCSEKQYGDFEMYVDWKIEKNGDAGIYLRGSPQVQIWDTSRRDVGAQVGSGGLYNNRINLKNPLKVADNAIGEWNTLHITMKGDKVTVELNGELVVDNVVLENYWNRNLPIFVKEQIELQAHGTLVAYRDVYIKELPRPEPFVLSEQEKAEGFKILFDGTSMFEWLDNPGYKIDNGNILYTPSDAKSGANLMTKNEYSDFVFRFEFQLTPGANNGLGIRAPLEGDAAYQGMEIQILDDDAEIYKKLEPYQYHGSVYGIIPAKRGFHKPMGEWNKEEVQIKGSKIKVVLNGEVIVDGDLDEATKNGTLDKREHPGLKRTKGHIGFLGHGSVVQFRNIRTKDLSE